MGFAQEWSNRARHLFERPRFEDELSEEIQFHVETRAAELEASGVSRKDAMAQARREFGNVGLASEGSRAAWRVRWAEDLVTDVYRGLRGWARSPVFTATAVLSLALGIGGATAIFSALDAVLWRTLPVKDADQLVSFSLERRKTAPETDLPATFVTQLRQSGIFAGLVETGADGLSFSYDGRAERIVGESVVPDYFDVLGVSPLLGEAFSPAVRRGEWAAETVLSYQFWQRRFGGDPGVIGKTIHLNGYPFTIVGVTRRGFFGVERGADYELRIPIMPDGRELAQIGMVSGKPQRWMESLARLKPGVSLAAAEAAADVQLREFLRTTPIEQIRGMGIDRLRLLSAAHGYNEYTRGLELPLYVLLGLVAVLLLIACCNVAAMLLARGASRAREFAIRTSIGAGRLRLIRQLLAESLMLAVIGGALGLAFAYWAAGVIFHFLPQGHIALAIDLHPDRRALLFAMGLSGLVGVLFGLPPAFQATRGSLVTALRSGVAGAMGGGPRALLREMLVVSQVAFSILLLAAAGMFVETVAHLQPSEFRGDPSRVLLFTMKPQPELYSEDQKRRLAEELVRRVGTLPGVRRASIAENGPFASRNGSTSVQVPGHAAIRAGFDAVDPGFLNLVGIPVVAGREFEGRDRPGSQEVVIVNQSLAKELFPNENPIGRSVILQVERKDTPFEIVGVAADVRYYDAHEAPRPFLWRSLQQNGPYMPTLHVRIAGSDTGTMIAAVRREFDAIDKGFPVFNIRTMADRMDDALAGERMVASITEWFGALALTLAAVGIYGVLAYSVSRRTREIGVRIALGARRGTVVWLVARKALVLVMAGTAVGGALALIGSQILAQYLRNMSGLDLRVAGAAAVLIALITAAAVTMPALRGCRIDPLQALRQD